MQGRNYPLPLFRRYFLTESQNRDPDELRKLLPDATFRKATGILEMIAKSPELRLIYDDRAKEAKDRYSELKDAEARGKLIGRIQTLQELVSDTISDDAILSSQTTESLEKMIRELKLRLVKRG